MEYWIQQFFNEKFDEYDDFAIPMNDKLESDGYLTYSVEQIISN